MNLKTINVPPAGWAQAAGVAARFSGTYLRKDHTGVYHGVAYVDRTGGAPTLYAYYTQSGNVVVRANDNQKDRHAAA